MNGCSLPITLICQLRTASEEGSAVLVPLSLAIDEPSFAAIATEADEGEEAEGAVAEAAAGAEGSLDVQPAIKRTVRTRTALIIVPHPDRPMP